MSSGGVKVSIRNVGHRYFEARSGHQVTALEDVSLDVLDNEFLCLVGPSGCGKSTLLQIVAGLIVPTVGQIVMNGRAVRGPGADRGMVFQEYALMPWKTVKDNIVFGLMIRKRPREERERVAQHYLQLMNLTPFADRFPHQLSGGMKQRVAVARTMANSPEVMLMDEPFAAVDAQTRAILQEELIRLVLVEQLTTIFVTHAVEEAIFLADRVVVLSARPGRIKEVVTVGIPREARNWATLENKSEFLRLRQHVTDLVRAEAREGWADERAVG